MKIFSAEQIREWDQYTIEHIPIASIDLMERAAAQCVQWLENNDYIKHTFHIFCGKGNNGGDGLAIARMLAEVNCTVSVNILEFGHKGTDDFQINLARIHQLSGIEIRFIQSAEHFRSLEKSDIVIDALFGSGLNRGLEGVTAELVNHLNNSGCEIISIDIPSGLFVDSSSKGNTIIKATHTLAFQCYKLAFLLAENAAYLGEVHILNIQLHPSYYDETAAAYVMTDRAVVQSIYKPRNRFAHKGNFGHALLIAGSYGKMGAALLAAKACLRSGSGLLTCHIPQCGYDSIQTAVPEAMASIDFHSFYNTRIKEDLSKYNTIGIGPGIGTDKETARLVEFILQEYKKPLVLDADALNCIATKKELLQAIPAQSILTPHPKEFDRLFGESANELERIEKASQKAQQLNIVIVLKGHHTLIASSTGNKTFNTTGNAGMAKGGSGDVLTGIITSLLSQSYSSEHAAIFGVYLHGLAGDIAIGTESMESVVAGDLIENLGRAFKTLSPNQP